MRQNALADPSLWTRLDMTLVNVVNGAEDERFYVVLRGAAAARAACSVSSTCS
jgi:hypothetical protein